MVSKMVLRSEMGSLHNLFESFQHVRYFIITVGMIHFFIRHRTNYYIQYNLLNTFKEIMTNEAVS